MRGILKKSWNVLSLLLVLLLVLLAVMSFVSKIRNRPFFLFGRATLWILTDSMEDTVPAQSYILVKKADPQKIRVGDVITFVSDDPALHGSLNTHRVIDVNEQGDFITKGDHNPSADRIPAAADKVVGVYVRNLPILTGVGRFFRTVPGLVTALLLILLVTAGYFLPDLCKRRKARTQQAMEEAVRLEVERLRAQDARSAAGGTDDGAKDTAMTSEEKGYH